MHHTKNKTFRS